MRADIRKRLEAVETAAERGNRRSVFDDPNVRARADAAVRELNRRIREDEPEPTALQYREYFALLIQKNLTELSPLDSGKAKYEAADKIAGPFRKYALVTWADYRMQTDSDGLYARMKALDEATEEELAALRDEAALHDPATRSAA